MLRLNLTGQRFERLLVIEMSGVRDESTYWKCRCDCGNECEVAGKTLKSAQKRSCGCLQKERTGASAAVDITGHRSGLLTAIRWVATENNCRVWECACDCGNTTRITAKDFNIYKNNGNAPRSCGCVNNMRGPVTHGMTGTREYEWWFEIKKRCSNPKHRAYENYGGRGITMCERWASSFEAFFLEVMREAGPRPSPAHSLDRWPDNNKGYEPGNVRWATKRQQARNMRTTRMLTFRGETRPLVEFSEILDINQSTVKQRIAKGMDVEAALTQPVVDGRFKAKCLQI